MKDMAHLPHDHTTTITDHSMAIDPGPTESAYAIISNRDLSPVEFGKIPNDQLRDRLARYRGPVAIETIASYGMPVGAEVFDTCIWVGRYIETIIRSSGRHAELVKRQPVRLHHTHSIKATDANVTRALVDRFTPGQPNYGKGSKIDPGWFYGFAGDIWQAYALAVYAADTREQMSA